MAIPPFATISRTTLSAALSSPGGGAKSLITTRAPREASIFACDRPMPRPAPVTTATRPPKSSNDILILHLQFFEFEGQFLNPCDSIENHGASNTTQATSPLRQQNPPRQTQNLRPKRCSTENQDVPLRSATRF